MSRIAAPATSVLRGTHNRSVFVRVSPAPENLAERRAVLRMLQRHGAVEMFKKLAGNDSFISIMSSVTAASDLVERSPIQYELITENKFDAPLKTASSFSQDITGPVEPIVTSSTSGKNPFARSSSNISSSPTDNDSHSSDPLTAATPEVGQKSFVLHAFLSDRYFHKTAIRQSPLHGPWPSEPASRDTFVFNALRKVVPCDEAADALCDWDTGGQLSGESRALRWTLGRGEEGSHVAYIMERRERNARRRGEEFPSTAARPPAPPVSPSKGRRDV